MREHELVEGNEHEVGSEYEEENEHEVGSEYKEENEHEEERVGKDDSIGHDGGAPVRARDRGGNGLVKAHEVNNGSHGREGVKGGDRRTHAREEGMEYGGDNDNQKCVLALRNRTPEGYNRPGRTTGHRTHIRMA